MPRVRVLTLVVLCAGAGVAAQQRPTFRSGTHTVPVYATVLDAEGRLVPNLTKDDFEIFDNDEPQPIGVFDNTVRPITIVIMLDRSGSMRPNFDLERSAAVQFVANLLPDDKARLGSFSSRIKIDPQEFTSNQDELIRILYEELLDPGPTPLWGATSAAMTALAHQDDRRVVLVLTDGFDNPMDMTVTASFQLVRDRSEAEEIMVYGIGLAERCDAPVAGAWSDLSGAAFQTGIGGFGRGRGIGGGPVGRGGGGGGGRGGPFGRGATSSECNPGRPDPQLKDLAASSGGGYFEINGSEDLGWTFAQVANELHHQYLLGFAAPALDGKVHRLKVRLRTAGLRARARQSYVAATPH